MGAECGIRWEPGGVWFLLPLSAGEEFKREPLTLSLVLMSTEQSSLEEEVSFQVTQLFSG